MQFIIKFIKAHRDYKKFNFIVIVFLYNNARMKSLSFHFHKGLIMKKNTYSNKRELKKNSSFLNNPIVMLIGFCILSLAGWMIFKRVHKSIQPKEEFVIAANIIRSIDNDCKIIKLIGNNNPINFFNIKEFSGNTVGSIQIADPEKWKGPYLDYIPSYNDQPLSLVNTASGIYIVPGNGTVLANNKIVGTDIIIDDKTDMNNIVKEYPELILDNKKALYIAVEIKLPASIQE